VSAHEHQRREFVKQYEVYFGPFPDSKDPDKLRLWYRLTDKLPLPRITELMQAVTDRRGGARWLPRFEDFNRAWKGLTGAELSLRHKGCEFCEFRGVIPVIGVREGREWKLYSRPGQFPLSIFTVPCLCGKGDRYAAENSRPRREEAHDWKVAMLDEMQKRDFRGGYYAYIEKLVRDEIKRRMAEAEEIAEQVAKADDPKEELKNIVPQQPEFVDEEKPVGHVSELFVEDADGPELIPF